MITRLFLLFLDKFCFACYDTYLATWVHLIPYKSVRKSKIFIKTYYFNIKICIYLFIFIFILNFLNKKKKLSGRVDLTLGVGSHKVTAVLWLDGTLSQLVTSMVKRVPSGWMAHGLRNNVKVKPTQSFITHNFVPKTVISLKKPDINPFSATTNKDNYNCNPSRIPRFFLVTVDEIEVYKLKGIFSLFGIIFKNCFFFIFFIKIKNPFG